MGERAGSIKRFMLKYFRKPVQHYKARDLVESSTSPSNNSGQMGGDTKSHARLTASSMTSPCDLISSRYIVMTEDLTWQPAQSTPTHSLMKWQDRKREQKRNSLSWRGY